MFASQLKSGGVIRPNQQEIPPTIFKPCKTGGNARAIRFRTDAE